jgi:hypothetical protein
VEGGKEPVYGEDPIMEANEREDEVEEERREGEIEVASVEGRGSEATIGGEKIRGDILMARAVVGDGEGREGEVATGNEVFEKRGIGGGEGVGYRAQIREPGQQEEPVVGTAEGEERGGDGVSRGAERGEGVRRQDGGGGGEEQERGRAVEEERGEGVGRAGGEERGGERVRGRAGEGIGRQEGGRVEEERGEGVGRQEGGRAGERVRGRAGEGVGRQEGGRVVGEERGGERIRRQVGEGGREEHMVVDVEENSQDGMNIQNMLSSLVYSLGLNEMETKQIISLWHNRTIVPPLDPAYLSHELARREQLFREEHSNFELQTSRARLQSHEQVCM